MDEFSQVMVEFNNKASGYFFSYYDTFKKTVKKLDRQKDENVFQQQQALFLRALKNRLEFIARELLDKNKSPDNSNRLNKKLTDAINDFLVEFRQKSRSL